MYIEHKNIPGIYIINSTLRNSTIISHIKGLNCTFSSQLLFHFSYFLRLLYFQISNQTCYKIQIYFTLTVNLPFLFQSTLNFLKKEKWSSAQVGDCISGTFTNVTGSLNARMNQMKMAAKMVCSISFCTLYAILNNTLSTVPLVQHIRSEIKWDLLYAFKLK